MLRWYMYIHEGFFNNYLSIRMWFFLEVQLPYAPHVGQSVILSWKGGKLHFHTHIVINHTVTFVFKRNLSFTHFFCYSVDWSCQKLDYIQSFSATFFEMVLEKSIIGAIKDIFDYSIGAIVNSMRLIIMY